MYESHLIYLPLIWQFLNMPIYLNSKIASVFTFQFLLSIIDFLFLLVCFSLLLQARGPPIVNLTSIPHEVVAEVRFWWVWRVTTKARRIEVFSMSVIMTIVFLLLRFCFLSDDCLKHSWIFIDLFVIKAYCKFQASIQIMEKSAC